MLVFGAIEMEKEILRIISLFIVLGGLYIFLKPDIVAAKIRFFIVTIHSFVMQVKNS